MTGVLPIKGRVTVSAGLLDTLAPKDKEKREVWNLLILCHLIIIIFGRL